MVSSHDNVSMALFCDFENVALGVRDAKYDKFDIRPILERLLLKGSIVIKKAYCDWDRYKGFKASMHEANFELIEIPHVRQSGKNSADIRLVVDALDLCYTKSHVNTFVIISGDSDFSPLVSKLRENAKQVIGVGVKQSTSDLLIANCDEFIFYDDLVRESQRAAAKREMRETHAAPRRTPDEEKRRKEELDARKSKAIEMAVETFDALVSERGDSGKMWASVLKEAIKRRKPDFNESYYGFRAFGNLLEEAQARGLLEVGRDEKSGTYVSRATAAPNPGEPSADPQVAFEAPVETSAAEESAGRHEPRRRGRGGRGKPPAHPSDTPMANAAQDTAESGHADSYDAGHGENRDESHDSHRSEHESAAHVESRGADQHEVRGAGRGARRRGRGRDEPATEAAPASEAVAQTAVAADTEGRQEPRRRSRGGRSKSAETAATEKVATEASQPTQPQAAAMLPASPAAGESAAAAPDGTAAEAPRKTPARPRRARKTAAVPNDA